MTIPSQLLQIPLRVGLGEGTDPKQLPPGTLTEIINGVWNKSGLLEKRFGTRNIDTNILGGGSLTPDRYYRGLSRGKELAQTDGVRMYSRVPAVNLWKDLGAMTPITATWKPLLDTMSSIDQVDVDANASIKVMTWVAGLSGGNPIVWVAVKDVVTDAFIVPPKMVDIGNAPKVCIISATQAIAMWRENGTNNFNGVTINLSTFAVSAVVPAVVNNGHGTTLSWDLELNGSNATMVYITTANDVTLRTVSPALALVTGPVVVANAAATLGMSLAVQAATRIYVVYSVGGVGLRAAVHNPTTLAQVTAPNTVRNSAGPTGYVGVCVYDNTNCIVALTENLVAFGESLTTLRVSSAAVADVTTRRVTHWARLSGKPFLLPFGASLEPRVYFMATTQKPPLDVTVEDAVTQTTTFCSEAETTSVSNNPPHRLSAVVAPRESILSDAQTVSRVPVVGSTAYAPSYFITEPTAGGKSRRGLYCVTIKNAEATSDLWKQVGVDNSLALAGPVLNTYDGRACLDALFITAPHAYQFSSAGGGAMAAGTYLYAFVYEWRDANGVLHRSIPSQIYTVTGVPALGKVDWELSVAGPSDKIETGGELGRLNPFPVYIVPYRSKVGGTTLYRMTNEGINSNVIVNDSTGPTVTWSDTSADNSIDAFGTDLDTRPPIYTGGGIREDAQPPGFITNVIHRGRIFGVAGDLSTIWFSKPLDTDTRVFPGFHEDFRIVLEEDITGLASLDDKLIVFTADAIYAVTGEGPNAAGVGAEDLSDPIQVQSDVGCINPRSIVETPEGVMFLARRGLYLLTRSLEVKWIGRDVQDKLRSTPEIVGAVLVAHRNQVRFICRDPLGSASPRQLVWDYVHGVWSTFINVIASVAQPSWSLYHDGVFHYGSQNALVRADDETTYLDEGTNFVFLQFELAWISSTGPCGWQHVRRVQLLGEKVTNHALQMQLGFGYSASYAQSYTFSDAQVAINNDSPTMRVGSQNGASPSSKAIRIRVTDAAPGGGSYPTGSGQGGKFSAIALEIVPRPGLARHGANASKV